MDVFYSYKKCDQFLSLEFSQDSDWETFFALTRGEVPLAWRPLLVKWVGDEAASRKPDFYSALSGAIIAREEAWADLAHMLGDYVKPHELWDGEERLFLLYVDFYDVLDPSRSVFRRLPNGKAYGLERWALRDGCVLDRALFRVPGLTAPVLCTNAFVEFVNKRSEGGLAFEAVKPV